MRLHRTHPSQCYLGRSLIGRWKPARIGYLYPFPWLTTSQIALDGIFNCHLTYEYRWIRDLLDAGRTSLEIVG